MSYFTNIAVQNVNKGFVYITDLTWSLNEYAAISTAKHDKHAVSSWRFVAVEFGQRIGFCMSPQ